MNPSYFRIKLDKKDAVPYGDFVAVKNGMVTREFADFQGVIERNSGRCENEFEKVIF